MTSSLPFVSAVVTAYNYERYLGDALDSALAQDYPADRLEIIVVDDGSTDGTPDLARRYAAEHPGRIRYIRQDNSGLAAATTRGLQEARGELITLLDADDAWVTSRTRLLVDALERNPGAGLVYGDMEVIDGDGRMLARSWLTEAAQTPFRGRVVAHLLRSNFVIAPSLMFRAAFRDRVCPIPSFFPAQDWYIAARVADVAEVDSASRDLISEAGHGEYFTHGLGHGVGLLIHEAPWLAQNETGTLQDRVPITIEPGIYLAGAGGVRIEDTLVVRAGTGAAGSAQSLTTITRELLVL